MFRAFTAAKVRFSWQDQLEKSGKSKGLPGRGMRTGGSGKQPFANFGLPVLLWEEKGHPPCSCGAPFQLPAGLGCTLSNSPLSAAGGSDRHRFSLYIPEEAKQGVSQ